MYSSYICLWDLTCHYFPKVNADEISLDSVIDQSKTNTSQTSKRRRMSESSSVTVTSSAAHIIADGMKDAVNPLKEQREEREDVFDTFGKYVATELRSLADPNYARQVRVKLARCLMDCIEFQPEENIYLHT